MADRGAAGEGADGGGLALPSSVGLARRYAVNACRGLGWGEAADDVALLVSEIAANAILPSYGSEIRVSVRDDGLRLRISVFDGSPVLPVPRSTPPGAENGRGLALVEALALDWGVDTQPGGKTFWVELGL